MLKIIVQTCLIPDGSCTFEFILEMLIDGIVDERDVDGLWYILAHGGALGDHESIDWYVDNTDNGWEDICAAYADTNGDGHVDHLDLSAILYNWNSYCNL